MQYCISSVRENYHLSIKSLGACKIMLNGVGSRVFTAFGSVAIEHMNKLPVLRYSLER